MENDLLIDFNSPQTSSGNMMDPLVPLPKVQTRDIPNNETGKTFGDNPFDNVLLQLCQEADPFDIMEKKAQKTNPEYNISSEVKSDCQPVSVEDQQCKKTKEGKNLSLFVKTSPHFNEINLIYGSFNFNQTSPSLEKSASASYLSPVSEKIENKFSKLYLSAQFDKQIFDESSKCIDSGMQDVSIEFSSARERSKSAEVIAMDLPDKEEEIKAFIANRIEKCIEKTITETRKSLNSSLRHRRSLSAASLYSGLGTKSERVFATTNVQQSSDNWTGFIPSKYRSLSNHDILASLESSIRKNTVECFLNKVESEKFSSSSLTDRFNTAFRKSTATSSMYSSYGLWETGFRKSNSSLSSYRKSSSSFSLSLPHVGDDSVFTRSSLNQKSTESILLEAKNLSCLLHQKACSEGDEPLDCDNFLTDGKLDIQLVDSDSSLSEEETDIICNMQSSKDPIPQNNQPALVKGATPFENAAPLSRTNVVGLSLTSKVMQPQKTRSPLLAPPIPVPVKSTMNAKELVLRPKAKSESRVVMKGPMKAMIPVGSMVRSASEKSHMPGRTGAGSEIKKGVSKSVPGVSSLVGKSGLKGTKGSTNSRQTEVASAEINSPIQLCARPVACSTPTADTTPPLVSPSVGLQMSHISPSPAMDGGHRRSRSAGCQQNCDAEDMLSSTPARKPPRRIRSEDGRLKTKLKSPMQASPKEPPTFTSTPLKQIAKNSPPVNRVKHTSQVPKKLVHPCEKENLLPSREMRGYHTSSRTSRF